MAGTRKRKSTSVRPANPALGNDPFERGAAPRRPARFPAGESARARPRALAPVAAPPPPSPADAVQARVDRVEAKVELAFEGAEARLAELVRRSGVSSYAGEVLELARRLLPALYQRVGSLSSLWRLLEAPAELDAFGMDPELPERAALVLDFLFSSWWRVEVRRAERVPEGPAVIVANHGGALPWDALVLRLAFLRQRPRRELRPLLGAAFLEVPVAGKAALRLGAVPATPENAARLLGEGKLVAAFPEGSRGGAKPWGDRYRLQRFGRGGFAKVALRAGAPIVPCAIVGSEETSPAPSRPGWLAERLRLPILALAPPLPLGPVALLPLPARWSLRFGDPLDTRAAGPAAADDPAAVHALTERVRAALQRMLDEDLSARRSIFL